MMTTERSSAQRRRPLIVAMFLPQFHRDNHNDKWWGLGFTEWDNVRRARPLYSGHLQPRLPVNGFFDLSSADELAAQWSMAASHGIDGFAIYDYWYAGERILHTPLDIVRRSTSLPVRYSLAWANHPWTRSWSNRVGALDTLMPQTYPSDLRARNRHYQHLLESFLDPRYIRLGDRPLLQVYNPPELAAQPGYIDGLRDYCQAEGNIEPHVSAMITGWHRNWTFLNAYDSTTLFQPSLGLFAPDRYTERDYRPTRRLRAAGTRTRRLLYMIADRLPDRPRYYDYDLLWVRILDQFRFGIEASLVPVLPMAVVNFDNTPRYGARARILRAYSLEKFESNLSLLASTALASGAPMVFVNSWNEWGEGAHLQPDDIEGFARLEAVRRVADRLKESVGP